MSRPRFGFALVELLVVVSILSILAVIAVPNMTVALVKSKHAKVRNDLRVIAMALEGYAADHGKSLSGFLPGFQSDNSLKAYVSSWPKDSFRSSSRQFRFEAGSNNVQVSPAGYAPMHYSECVGFPFGLGGVDAQLGTTIVQELRVDWIIASVGPDQEWNNGAMEQILYEHYQDGHYHAKLVPPLTQPFRDYDPTNGIVSTGNIFRTNVSPEKLGVHPVLFEEHFGEEITVDVWEGSGEH